MYRLIAVYDERRVARFCKEFISDIISSLVKLFLFSRVKIKNTVSYIKLTKLKTVLIGTVFNLKKKN